MNRKYRFGIYLSALLLCAAYCVSYQNYQEVPQEELVKPVPSQSVTLSGDNRVYQYYLLKEGDYVYVYLDDKTTLYETTSIRVDTLPEALQQEVKNGKSLATEHDLYNFLENYSS